MYLRQPKLFVVMGPKLGPKLKVQNKSGAHVLGLALLSGRKIDEIFFDAHHAPFRGVVILTHSCGLRFLYPCG